MNNIPRKKPLEVLIDLVRAKQPKAICKPFMLQGMAKPAYYIGDSDKDEWPERTHDTEYAAWYTALADIQFQQSDPQPTDNVEF